MFSYPLKLRFKRLVQSLLFSYPLLFRFLKIGILDLSPASRKDNSLKNKNCYYKIEHFTETIICVKETRRWVSLGSHYISQHVEEHGHRKHIHPIPDLI